MTREQLDAIRVLRSNCEDSYDGCFRVHLTEADYTTLITEVERLRAIINDVGEVISQNGEDCDCDCTAYGSPHGPDCDPCLACRVSDALGEKP